MLGFQGKDECLDQGQAEFNHKEVSMIYPDMDTTVKLNNLIGQAMDSCRFRGHSMGQWQKSQRSAYSNCLVCVAQASVNADPLPNGIDICGAALAIHCAGG